MSANDLYGASLDALNKFWDMNEARRAACRAYRFDGSEADKETMIRWQVYQNMENALLLQANTLRNMATEAAVSWCPSCRG